MKKRRSFSHGRSRVWHSIVTFVYMTCSDCMLEVMSSGRHIVNVGLKWNEIGRRGFHFDKIIVSAGAVWAPEILATIFQVFTQFHKDYRVSATIYRVSAILCHIYKPWINIQDRAQQQLFWNDQCWWWWTGVLPTTNAVSVPDSETQWERTSTILLRNKIEIQ